MGLGITTGTINRIKKGQVPSTEFLSRLHRFENVRVDWLLSGKGTPYLIDYCGSVKECTDLVDAIAEEDGWTTFVVSDGQRYAIVMQLSAATWEDAGKPPIAYRPIEIISTPDGLTDLPAVPNAGTYQLAPRDMDDLLAGKLGPYRLFEADDALLSGEPIAAHNDAVSDNEPTTYVSPAYAKLHQLIDQLPEHQVNAVTVLVKGLLSDH